MIKAKIKEQAAECREKWEHYVTRDARASNSSGARLHARRGIPIYHAFGARIILRARLRALIAEYREFHACVRMCVRVIHVW